jgi:protein TonB
MRTGLHGAALAALTSLSTVPALAEWRCDCTTITGSCRGDVTIQGSWVEVSSDRQECSRVDYFIDGLPFVAVVVGGVQRQDWIARTEGSHVLVQSCQVCRDNAGAERAQAPASRPAAAATEESGLTPIIKVVPQYPEAARAQGIEGRVELNFTVSSSGAVESPTVTASSPAGVFDQAALAAVSRWRYAPIAEDAPTRNASEVLVFELEGNASRAERARATLNIGRPRNECVREDAVYNYGDVVDVELINACAETLLVYSCAAGTGRHTDRWICASLEEAAQALVVPGDVRIGMPVNDSAGRGTFELTDRYLITRAPNTQYWWVACGSSDTACRESARLWMRSLNQQSAGVDPQARSTLAIGRSY